MKIIAFERPDGGVSIVRVTHGHLFGTQAGLSPDETVRLQRLLNGMEAEELAELERKFIVGQQVNLVSDGSSEPEFKWELPVLVSSLEAVTMHAQDLMQSGQYTRFVLLEEADLPSRETRERWKLDGDRVVAA